MALINDDHKIKPLSSLQTYTIKQHLSNLLDASKHLKKNVTVVDEVRNIKDSCDRLKSFTELIVDCEGVRLGRDGKLSLVQIMAKDGDVYLFDVLVLGKAVFDNGLKSILESKSISKIMFDCRMDSECLLHEYDVKLNNVMDMQLLEYLARPAAGTKLRGPTRPSHFRKPNIRGLDKSVNTYVSDSDIISKTGISDFKRVKGAGSGLMNLERTVWRYRPIHEGLRNYAALDVVMIDLLQDALTRFIKLEGLQLERLTVASDRYAGVRRDFAQPDNVYMRHSMLLSYIIPEIRGNRIQPFPSENAKCSGCKRMLAAAFVNRDKCEDCREIERANQYR